MNENQKRAAIIKDINETLSCHASPIESETSPGFPDINMCLKGVEMDVELKFVRGIEGSYEVQPTQVSWGKGRADAGGIVLWCLVVQEPREVFITLGCPHGHGGRYKFDRGAWTDHNTGCVVLEGEPSNWAKAFFMAAQSFAP